MKLNYTIWSSAWNETFPATLYKYHISSNRRHPQIVAAQSEALEQNKRHLQIVAMATKQGKRARVRMISNDGHHAMSRSHGWQQDWEAVRTTDSV